MLQIVCSSLPTLHQTSGDTHSLCVVWWGVKLAESALEGGDCPHCEWLPLHTRRSRKVLFEEGVFTNVPRGAGPIYAEAVLLGIADGGKEDGRAPIVFLYHQIHRPLSGIGSLLRGSSPQRKGSTLRLSSSEEGDVEDVDELSQSLMFAQAYCEWITNTKKLFTVLSGNTFVVSMCVPWDLNPQPLHC